MLIETNIIKSAYSVIDKREIREHLKCVCFDYDADSCELAIVGTDAQCMIINKVKINSADADFCKKWFSDNTGYYITDVCLGKAAFCDFGELLCRKKV